MYLFVLFLTSMLMLQSSVVTASGEASLIVKKYGAISDWSEKAVAEFIDLFSFSENVKSEFKGFKGTALSRVFENDLREALNVESTSDNVEWESCLAEIKGCENERGSGAEDLDLWSLREYNPRYVQPFFFLMLHPHLAQAVLHWNFNVDEAMFGKDEAKEKSPWSWIMFFLCPGLLTCRYVSYFYDTNPYLTVILCLYWGSSDVSWLLEIYGIWLGLSAPTSDTSRSIFGNFNTMENSASLILKRITFYGGIIKFIYRMIFAGVLALLTYFALYFRFFLWLNSFDFIAYLQCFVIFCKIFTNISANISAAITAAYGGELMGNLLQNLKSHNN
jgi:hypothetical protein